MGVYAEYHDAFGGVWVEFRYDTDPEDYEDPYPWDEDLEYVEPYLDEEDLELLQDDHEEDEDIPF